MNIIKLIFLSSTLLAALPNNLSVPSTSYANAFDYIEVPPLNLPSGGNTPIKVKVSFTESKIHTFSITITNSDYPTEETIYTISRRSRVIDVTVVYDNLKTRKNSVLRFYATDVTPVSVAPYLTSLPTMYPVLYDKNDYNNVYYYTRSKAWVLTKETFEFRKFDELYSPDFYHKLELNEMMIRCKAATNNTITYTSASVLIDNYDNLFSHAGTLMMSGTKVYIELKLVKGNDNWYYLAFKDKMYVHPTSLQMYNEKLPNVVETRHFYLPRGRMANQLNFRFQFSITKLGYNKVTLGHYININAPIDTIGNCVDSEYCVDVVNSEPELEMGEVEEH